MIERKLSSAIQNSQLNQEAVMNANQRLCNNLTLSLQTRLIAFNHQCLRQSDCMNPGIHNLCSLLSGSLIAPKVLNSRINTVTLRQIFPVHCMPSLPAAKVSLQPRPGHPGVHTLEPGQTTKTKMCDVKLVIVGHSAAFVA